MFLKINSFIRTFFCSLFSSVKENFLKLLLVSVILINSGTCYFGFAASSKLKAFFFIFSLFIVLLLWILHIDLSFIQKIKNKRLNFSTFIYSLFNRTDVLCIAAIFLISVINLGTNLVTHQSSNINALIGTSITILLSFFIVQLIEKNTFFSLFSNSIFIIAIISLLINSIVAISKVQFNTGNFWSVFNSYDSYFGLFVEYSDKLSQYGSQRLLGIFWEPGVFANFLLFGCIFELFYKEKINWLKICIFIFSLILTRSTAGIICLFVIFIAFLCKKIKGNGPSIISVLFVFLLAISLLFYKQIFFVLAKIFPDVFEKMIIANGSLETRIKSPVYFLQVFAKRPIFGFGFDSVLEQYRLIAPVSIDSATATFPCIIASLGIFGIVFTFICFAGIIKINNTKLNLPCRVLIAIAIFLISNTEVQTEILGISLFYFYGIKEYSRFSLKKDLFEEKGIKTLSQKIRLKSESGTFSVNIIGSIFLKGASILLGLLIIPAFSTYFKNDNLYGVWLAIVSVLTIILNFDFGVTDGLKNKLIEAKKDNDNKKIKALISNSYFVTLIISFVLLSIATILVWTLNWNDILNIAVDSINLMNLRITMMFVLGTICIELVLRNVTAILSAYGNIVLANSMMVITNLLLILSAYICAFVSLDKIIFMSICYLIFVSLPLIGASIYTFSFLCKEGRPSFKCLDKKVFKNLSDLGLRFFAIQLCNIILWGINNFIITNLYIPADVVAYTKFYKLFSTIISLYAIFQPTLWVYIAKAKKENDYKKIKIYAYISIGLSVFLALVSLIAGLACQTIFDLWLGSDSITVTFEMVLPFVLYGVLYSTMCSVSLLCFSLEILKSFTIVALIVGIIKIPLTYLAYYYIHGLSWTLIMWVNVILIIPYIFVPLIELIISYKKMKKEMITHE